MILGKKWRQAPSNDITEATIHPLRADDAQKPPHRLLGAFEGIRERTAESHHRIELSVGVAGGVAHVQQLTSLDAALGLSAADASLVQLELHLGDVGDHNSGSDRRQLEGAQRTK